LVIYFVWISLNFRAFHSGHVQPLSGMTNRVRAFRILTLAAAVSACGCSSSTAPAATAALTVPGAPTGLVATVAATSVKIAFTPPASNGGAPITNYIASCTANGTTITGSETASPVIVTGLLTGVTYDCVIVAVNSVGQGPASASISVATHAPFAVGAISRTSVWSHTTA
jgi:hypothetical protein